MEPSKELIAELRRVAYTLNRDTMLYSVAELMIAAANTIESDDQLIAHLQGIIDGGNAK